MDSAHVPVLSGDVLRILAPKSGESVLDCTLGLGGHAAAILPYLGKDGILFGLDADEKNLQSAKQHLLPWARQVQFHHANFRDVPSLNLPQVDIVFADLGLSSPHIDNPERGFSFRGEGPLDLRFDVTRGDPATTMLEHISVEALTHVFSAYGELQKSKTLAGLVLESLPKTTQDLRLVVEQCFTWRAPRVLPQVFQALRIWVNDECAALASFLSSAPSLLKPGGRIGIISYHSLEDRPVKKFFRALTTPTRDPVTGAVASPAPFMLLTKKSIRPSLKEQRENPRSRSAHFRAVRRG